MLAKVLLQQGSSMKPETTAEPVEQLYLFQHRVDRLVHQTPVRLDQQGTFIKVVKRLLDGGRRIKCL